MIFVEWFNERENKLCLSRIAIWKFILGFCAGECSLSRWNDSKKQFAHWVPWWKIKVTHINEEKTYMIID